MHAEILKYNETRDAGDKDICDVLAGEIERGLPGLKARSGTHIQSGS